MIRVLLHKKWGFTLVGWLLISFHFVLFSQFLPNAQGKLGHDYSYNLPMLLDGFYWYLNNGLFSVPWFTPSFCGGMPLLANPAAFYFSVSQFLTFLVDPLTSVRWTFFLFAALGFWGFFLLLTRIFATSRVIGLLGGTLFLFNGLYTYRFIIGHMEFHSFMLIPWLAWLLLRENQGEALLDRMKATTGVVISGVLIAYMFMSGMTQLLIPSLITVILMGLVRAYGDQEAGRLVSRFLICFGLAVLLSLALSGVKLVAALSFLENFQRDSYRLPGVPGLGSLLVLIFRVLALGGGGVDAAGIVVNNEFPLGRHELEYGLSVIPFMLIIQAFVLSPFGRPGTLRKLLQPVHLVLLSLILLLLFIPLGLNYYSPDWNHFLKSVPLIKSLSNFLRWFIIYIPFFILLSCLVLEKNIYLNKFQLPIVVVSIIIILGQNLMTEKGFYDVQGYDPGLVLAGYSRIEGAGKPPVIKNLTIPMNGVGGTNLIKNRNDALVFGNSQLHCYEPMFGYKLEFLPFKTSHPGPVLSMDAGVFNMKNPACYLYPNENQCRPGDHFQLDQRSELEHFVSFRPFSHRISTRQKVANLMSLFSLIGVLIFGVITSWFLIRHKK
ncbi:MAG: hypothetical protein KJ950_02520 [Proteobacteria bacterium]|nr:hypothetical protein [Pseudomonadota bacterium]MBU1686722.1 hypothetical protein [Pseudomonadota bacterium]